MVDWGGVGRGEDTAAEVSQKSGLGVPRERGRERGETGELWIKMVAETSVRAAERASEVRETSHGRHETSGRKRGLEARAVVVVARGGGPGSCDGDWQERGRSAQLGAGSTAESLAKASGRGQRGRGGGRKGGGWWRSGGKNGQHRADEGLDLHLMDSTEQRCDQPGLLLDIPFDNPLMGCPLGPIGRPGCTYRCQTPGSSLIIMGGAVLYAASLLLLASQLSLPTAQQPAAQPHRARSRLEGSMMPRRGSRALCGAASSGALVLVLARRNLRANPSPIRQQKIGLGCAAPDRQSRAHSP